MASSLTAHTGLCGRSTKATIGSGGWFCMQHVIEYNVRSIFSIEVTYVACFGVLSAKKPSNQVCPAYSLLDSF
jgi:hypothetical protein